MKRGGCCSPRWTTHCTETNNNKCLMTSWLCPLQLQPDDWLLHHLSHCPDGCHVHLNCVLLLWGETFLHWKECFCFVFNKFCKIKSNVIGKQKEKTFSIGHHRDNWLRFDAQMMSAIFPWPHSSLDVWLSFCRYVSVTESSVHSQAQLLHTPFGKCSSRL